MMNELSGTGLQSHLQGLIQPVQSMEPYQSMQPYLQSYLTSTPIEREPRAYELVIERIADKVRMDYGAELRILIADPIKGIDLRDAIQKLKAALAVA